MDSSLILAAVVALGLLYWWSRDRWKEHERKVQEKHDQCPHPPEQQRTMRVNSMMHPMAQNMVIEGARWLVKQCDRCGKQWPKYRPTLQPWDEFVDEYNQETRDREAQYAARKRQHDAEQAYKERRRLEQRNSDRS